MTGLAKQRPDFFVATERLTMRPLRLDDAAQIYALFANWDVVRYLSAPPWPYSIDDAHAFVADCRQSDQRGRRIPSSRSASTAI